MKSLRRTLAVCCVLGLLMALCGCSGTAKQPEKQGKEYYLYFDTVSYVYSYAGDSEETFAANCSVVEETLKTYHQLFDIYNEYEGINNLCTVNRLAGGEPVEVDERLIDFLLYAKELHGKTNGEMNILLGAVLSIWHDYRTAALEDPDSAAVPTQEELLDAAQHTDISLLEIDEARHTVRLTDPEASIDVGAVGKGYATEQAAAALIAQGADSYVLDIGGNLRIIGSKPDGAAFTTGIRDPKAPNSQYAAIISVADTSCVTSGDYERYFEVDGMRYHHIIDQDTLWPADYFSSVTVITQDSALADALSTALFTMPYEAGCEVVEAMDGVEVFWILHDGTTKYTPGLETMLTK